MLNKNKKIVVLIIGLILFFSPTPGKTQEQSLWEDLGLYGGQINTVAIDPESPSTMYAGSWGGDGLFKTTDSGSTWSNIPAANPSWFRNLEVYDIAVDPNNPSNIWVANGHYVDFSSDYGETWTTYFFASDEGRLCYSVAVDPFDTTGKTVYVGTGGPNNTNEYGEIFITEDGGEYWFKMEFVIGDTEWYNFWDISFNPNQEGEVWVANRASFLSPNGRIYMSPDFGGTWWFWTGALWQGEYYPFGYLDEVVVNPKNPLLVFTGSGNGVARNTQGGDADYWYWTPLVDSCRALCIPPQEPDTVYAGLISVIAKSTDNGENWDSSLESPSELLALQPHPAKAENLYAGSLNQGVFVSEDGARTWNDINIGIRANTIYDTVISPYSSTTILSGTLAGVYLSQSGSSWNLINDSISQAVVFHPNESTVFYSGFDWELGKTTDSGATWTYLDVSDDENSHHVSSIAVGTAGSSETVLFAGVSFGSGKKGLVVKVNDTSGDISNATLTSVHETTTPVNAIAAHPTNADILFAGSGSFYAPVAPGTLYRSSDGGSTWLHAQLPDVVVNSISIAPSNNDIIFIGCGGSNATNYNGIYKSTDGGSTWEHKTKGLPDNLAVTDISVDINDSNIIYAALYKGYTDSTGSLAGTYVSLDGGEYWTQIGLSDYRQYDIHNTGSETASAKIERTENNNAFSFPSSTITAGTASGLYKSTTAGTGVITGRIYSPVDDSLIDGAVISTSTGSSSLSDQGYYMMLVPAGVHMLRVTVPGYTQLTVPSVTVGTGTSVEQNIDMAVSGVDNNTTCLATSILTTPARSEQLNLLRTFRDLVLAETALGKCLIQTYYRLGGEIIPLLQRNPEIRGRCIKGILRSLPVIRNMVEQKRLLPAFGLTDEINSIIIALEKKSPTDLQKELQAIRLKFKKIPHEKTTIENPHRP